MRNQAMRVVVVREDGFYVAQWVDRDIAAYSRESPEAAIEEFVRMVIRYVLLACETGQALFQDVPPAPGHYLEEWYRLQANGSSPREFVIPPFKITNKAFDEGQLPNAGWYQVAA